MRASVHADIRTHACHAVNTKCSWTISLNIINRASVGDRCERSGGRTGAGRAAGGRAGGGTLVYLFVCVCVGESVYVCVCVYLWVCMRDFVRVCLCGHVCVYACVYKCNVYTFVYSGVCLCVCAHVYACARACECMFSHAKVRRDQAAAVIQD